MQKLPDTVSSSGTGRYPGDLLEHLRSFELLAARVESDPRGAYEATAAALELDPSVLRRRMQTLSVWLGVPLLAGRGARLRISREGRSVTETAGRVAREVEQLREAVGASPGRVVIGCTGTVTTELLPSVLSATRRRWPGLELRILRAGAARARALLARGELDLGVVRAAEKPEGLAARRLCADRMWLALPAGHPLAQRRRLTARAVASLPLISYGPGSATRRRVMETLAPLGARVAVEIEGKAAALRYVELGLGAALLSLLPGHRLEAEGVVTREVTRLFATASFWVVWESGRPLRATERFVIDRMTEQARRRAV